MSMLMYRGLATVMPSQQQPADAAATNLQGREDAAKHQVVQLARQALLLTARLHITRCYLPDSFNQAQAHTLHSMPQQRYRAPQLCPAAGTLPAALPNAWVSSRAQQIAVSATHLRLSLSFFMTSFWREACLERWNMDGSQLLERSTLMLGALPPRSCGSWKQVGKHQLSGGKK
jgi:hypothetical protein